MDTDKKTPAELAALFSRCGNYPKDETGFNALAQGIKRASLAHPGVSMDRIVVACTAASSFCPTDADMLTIAAELAEVDRRREYDAQAGATRGRTGKCPYGLCDGSGWREVCHLHTHHVAGDTGPAYVEKAVVTREQYHALSTRIDWSTQQLYESRYRCKCHPAREPEAEPRPRRRKRLERAAGGAE